ncbi:hypothetical protein BDA99DRAFT_519933 [Phascolomyces articulosus]|uniref:Uncharacterized protein n=1 Tax=Phascolomyces articulosus TaxID=60185 RepID=A0AAD5JTB4_9FUNG|nr:hypothetical protein BDA99DRAFT_519933 [Phascolomyces articulosus]
MSPKPCIWWIVILQMTITRTINYIDNMSKSIREAKRDFLTLAACMDGSKSNVVEGVVNLANFCYVRYMISEEIYGTK